MFCPRFSTTTEPAYSPPNTATTKARSDAVTIVRTPYEKFRSLPNAEQHLKPGQSFVLLDANANAMSGFEEAVRQTLKKMK